MSTTEENEHDWFNKQIATYLAQGLHEDERQRFESHAQSCDTCAAELAAMKQMEGEMTALFAAATPGLDFEDRLIDRLQFRVEHRRKWVHPVVKRSAIAVAAAIVVGGFGFVGKEYVETGSLPTWNTITQSPVQIAANLGWMNSDSADEKKIVPAPIQDQAAADNENDPEALPIANPPSSSGEKYSLVGGHVTVNTGTFNSGAASYKQLYINAGAVQLSDASRKTLVPGDIESAQLIRTGQAGTSSGYFEPLAINNSSESGAANSSLDFVTRSGTSMVRSEGSFAQQRQRQTGSNSFGLNVGTVVLAQGNTGAVAFDDAAGSRAAPASGTMTVNTGGAVIFSANSGGSVNSRKILKGDVTTGGPRDLTFGGLGTLAGNGTVDFAGFNQPVTALRGQSAGGGTIAFDATTGGPVNLLNSGQLATGSITFQGSSSAIELGANKLYFQPARNGALGTGPVATNSPTPANSIENLSTGVPREYAQSLGRQQGQRPGGSMNFSGALQLNAGAVVVAQGGGPAMVAQAAQQPNGGAAAQAPAQAAPTIRKVIREGVMEFEVDSFDSTFAQVSSITGEEGGFIAAADSDKLPNGKMRGTITLRVPPDNLDRLVLKLRALGELKSQRLGSKDIGKEYTDLEGQLRAARAMESRLLEMIKTAQGEVADLLQAERELGTWRTKIEQITGQLTYYNNLVSMATLTINAYEKDIRTPASASQTEEINTGVETENVEASRAAAIAKIDEAKGRIIESTLQQLEAGQFAAKIVAEVPSESAGEIVDRLRQLGRIARLDVQRKQTPTQGTSSLGVQPRVEQAPTRIIISMYNLANVAPRLTTNLNLAGEDVEIVYRAILARVQGANGRVLSSNLNRQDATQATGVIQFEVKSTEADAVLNEIRANKQVQVLQLNVTENPDTANVTTAKQAFTVQIIPTSRVAPREMRAISVETSDVEKGMQNLSGAVSAVGGRVLESSLSQDQAGRSIARLVVEVPLDQADPLVEVARKQGKVRTAESSKNTQVPEGPLARARLTVLIGSGETIVPSEGGLWPTIREGLSTSVKGLLWSLQLIVIGLCLIGPWVLMIWGGWKLLRRGKRTSSQTVT